jgi:hypothetical protein
MLTPQITQALLVLSVVSNTIAYAVYVWQILKNKIRPHAVTFLVWSVIMLINLVVQIISEVGWAWLLLASNFLWCFVIFILAYHQSGLKYDSLDKTCLFLALTTILLWLVTSTPLYSVILSCLIDALAIFPSFRKSFRKPGEDSSFTFFISGTEYLISLPSYKSFSFISVTYPVWVMLVDFSYAGYILIRRLQLKRLTAKQQLLQ